MRNVEANKGYLQIHWAISGRRDNEQCPTSTNAVCEGTSTYTNWDETFWSFGSRFVQPTLRDALSCPPGLQNCRYLANNADTDADGIKDEADNCPLTLNPNQADTDEDGVGNACDDN